MTGSGSAAASGAGAGVRAGGRRGRRGQLQVVAEDGVVQGLQLGARFDAELLDQLHPPDPVRVERLRPAPAPVPGQHQLGAQPLAQRVGVDEDGEVVDEFPVPAQGQLQLDALLGERQPAVVQPSRLRLDEHALDARQDRAAPQAARLGEQPGGSGEVARALREPRLGGEALGEQVDGDDPARAQDERGDNDALA